MAWLITGRSFFIVEIPENMPFCRRDKEGRVITMIENEANGKLRVIVCRPDEMAEVIEIDDSLDAMQALVGGLIEEYDPFYSESDPRYENVMLVCNEEGKFMQMPPSRAITDENGVLLDVIAGPFFLCYAPIESERYLPLPEDLEEEFLKKYELPEKIYRTNRGILAVKYEPSGRTREEVQER